LLRRRHRRRCCSSSRVYIRKHAYGLRENGGGKSATKSKRKRKNK
jgi:hypothetical protein